MKKISIITLSLLAVICASTTYAQRTAEDYYKTSKSRLSNRDLDGALAALDKAIELKPEFALAYFERNRIYMLKGKIDLAQADLDKALLIDPDLRDAYADRAQIRMIKGDAKGALSDLDNAIGRGVKSDDVYSSRGSLKRMTGDLEGAIADYDIAISMNSGRIGHHLGRGSTREQAGDESGALADYTYIIDRFEQEERDRLAVGKSARRAAPFDIVSPTMSGPASSASKGETTPNGKNQTTTRTDMTVGARLNSAMTPEEMEYLPNVAGAYMNSSSIYSKKGDSDAAMADVNKSITIDPSEAGYYFRGREFAKRGDLKAAIADFNRGIELRPSLAILYVERGAALMRLGKATEAERDFATALTLEPRMKTLIDKRRDEAKGQSETTPTKQ